jgi:hypothetical protein
MLTQTRSLTTIAALSLTLVSFSATAEVTRIRSLSETFNPKIATERNGTINGIAALLQKSDLVHILFVHGIGWTQQKDNPSMGFTLAEKILDQLGGSNSTLTVESACPTSGLKSSIVLSENAKTSTAAREKFLLINPHLGDGVLALRTDDPKGFVQSTDTLLISIQS